MKDNEAFFDYFKEEQQKQYEGIKLEPRPLPTEKDNTYNGANCLRCKWLDKSRTYKWQEDTLYVCKRKELINKASAKRFNWGGYDNVVSDHIPSDLKTDGYFLSYAWKCENKDIDEDLKPYLNELEF